jgi:exopolyphosphatase/guanosine-5'-triphosphate,3'-diphosphate pyrophosphatase
LIGRITTQEAFEVVLDTAETTRLGRGLQQAGRKLDPESIGGSINCLKEFRALCQREGVQKIVAVGTNALRIARDADQFVELVHKECGIILRVIGEQEEALLSFLSVQQDPCMPAEAVVMDVGGGSTEYIFRKDNRPSQSVKCISLPLGALQLTEKFLHDDPPSHNEVTKLRNKIDKTILQIPPHLEGALVGIGGTATTLGSMHLGLKVFDQKRIHGLLLKIDDLRAYVKELQEKDLARRKQIRGLSPERADIILAGTMIILSSMERLKKEVLHISSHGLRYGLFYQSFMKTE